MKILLAASLIFATACNGASVFFTATLDGDQEVPSVVTSGTGSVSLEVDDTTFEWTLTGAYDNLTGTVSGSHIHSAPAGSNGGVVTGLTNTAGQSGTLSGSGTFTAGQFDDLQNQLFYVNVHSTESPGGEIRGQLVPEPGSLALVGLGGLAFLRRRRG